MAFDITRFLVNSLVIERQGVDRDRSRQLALLPSFLDVSMVESLVLSTMVGSREAPAPEPPAKVAVPDVVGADVASAKRKLIAAGLEATVDLVDDEKNIDKVVRQDPEADIEVDPGSTVTLFVGKKPDTAGSS